MFLGLNRYSELDFYNGLQSCSSVKSSQIKKFVKYWDEVQTVVTSN